MFAFIRSVAFVRESNLIRKIDWEEAWDLNTRRHGRSHRNFIVETSNEWGRGRRNTHNGILDMGEKV